MCVADALPPTPPQAPIVITARALPDTAAEKAFDVRTIDREALRDNPSHALDAVLGQVAGLQLFRRSDSTSGHPTSQGVTSRALGGTASSRALLSLDGVPQSDPFGGWVNWPAYDPASLAEVRVIRGGGSVVNGPGALAGVIEMRSLQANGMAGSLEAGSRESLNGHVYFGERDSNGSFMLSAQGGRSAGFIPVTSGTRGPVDRRSPYEEASVRARWVRSLSSEVELQASALGFTDRRRRGTPFTGNRTRGADASVRLVGTGKLPWTASGYAQWRNLRSSFASVNDDRTAAQRVSLQYSVPGQAFGGSFELRPRVGPTIELRLGADARFADGESRELYAFSAGDPTRRRIAGGREDTEGFFGEASWTAGRLMLSGGARVDHWRIHDGRLTERLLATGAATRDDISPSRDGWRPTARTGLAVDLGGGFSLRSAAYLGWRLPTLNELFRPFRVGADATAANPLLDPERLSGAEAGFRFAVDGADLSVTAFTNRLSDAVANVTLGHGPGNFPGVGFVAGAYRKRQNIDAVKVRGFEVSGGIRRGPWSVRVDASYSDPKVVARGAAAALDGLRPAQTPKLALAGRLGWDREGQTAEITIEQVGAQFDDDQNLRRLPPVTTVGLFAAWPISRRLQLVGRAENLFNATVVAAQAEDGTIERATPRTLWLGLRFKAGS
jgi:outer membrane receptor protein involved in Fe transport